MLYMESMRRFRQALSDDQIYEILDRNTNGVLCLCDDTQPYGVPVSYVRHDRKIYIHCALSGRKNRILMHNPRCCFTVIDKDEIHPEKFTTYFASAMVFGKACFLETDEEKIEALHWLCAKYHSSMSKEAADKEIMSGLKRTAIICIDIEEMSGKQAKELVS